jgi:hypothetical protein
MALARPGARLERGDVGAIVGKTEGRGEALRPPAANLLVVRGRIASALDFLDGGKIDLRHGGPLAGAAER